MVRKFIKCFVLFSLLAVLQSCAKPSDIPPEIDGHWSLTIMTHRDKDILNSGKDFALPGQMIFYKKNQFGIIHQFENIDIHGTIDFSLFKEKDSVIIYNTDDSRLNGKYLVLGGNESNQNGKFKSRYYIFQSDSTVLQIERNTVTISF